MMNRTHQDSRRARRAFLGVFLACAAVILTVLYLQHWLNLDPCPWCIVQRLLLMLVAVVALLGAMHGPRAGGIRGYSGTIGVLGLSGVAAASYHLYLQSDPARAMKCAGSLVERLLDQSRLGQLLPEVFQYDGPCTLKPWSLLGLSIPSWSLITFLVILVAAFMLPRWIRRKSDSSF